MFLLSAIMLDFFPFLRHLEKWLWFMTQRPRDRFPKLCRGTRGYPASLNAFRPKNIVFYGCQNFLYSAPALEAFKILRESNTFQFFPPFNNKTFRIPPLEAFEKMPLFLNPCRQMFIFSTSCWNITVPPLFLEVL